MQYDGSAASFQIQPTGQGGKKKRNWKKNGSRVMRLPFSN
jgi:hypothetical protein